MTDHGYTLKSLNAKLAAFFHFIYSIKKFKTWYSAELNATIANGIVKGFNSNEFRPNEVVNREQVAKMLVNVLIKDGITPSTTVQQFSDDSDIAVWALEEVKMATEQKFVQGYPDNTFRPKRGLTRAEAAIMIFSLTRSFKFIFKSFRLDKIL